LAAKKAAQEAKSKAIKKKEGKAASVASRHGKSAGKD